MVEPVSLRPVDSVDLTILVDNSIDILLPSDERVRRAPLGEELSRGPQLIAEPGYSVLVTLESRGTRRSIVYDAGLSRDGLGHNLAALGLNLDDIEALVLSHGHADHHGGLEGVVRKLGRHRLPLVLHPDAWRQRRVVFPTGSIWKLPPPDRRQLERSEFEILEREGPSYLLSEQALITGRTPRLTEFEKGFPLQEAQVLEKWVADPWIWDDQAVICHVKGKGLVVVSGCSHAGVINVLRNAQGLTGIPKVHAFVGGLHLSGRIFEPIIPPTVGELRGIGPEFIVPGHCTGWKATHEIARAFPSGYVQTSVGTRLHFS